MSKFASDCLISLHIIQFPKNNKPNYKLCHRSIENTNQINTCVVSFDTVKAHASDNIGISVEITPELNVVMPEVS